MSKEINIDIVSEESNAKKAVSSSPSLVSEDSSESRNFFEESKDNHEDLKARSEKSSEPSKFLRAKGEDSSFETRGEKNFEHRDFLKESKDSHEDLKARSEKSAARSEKNAARSEKNFKIRDFLKAKIESSSEDGQSDSEDDEPKHKPRPRPRPIAGKTRRKNFEPSGEHYDSGYDAEFDTDFGVSERDLDDEAKELLRSMKKIELVYKSAIPPKLSNRWWREEVKDSPELDSPNNRPIHKSESTGTYQ